MKRFIPEKKKKDYLHVFKPQGGDHLFRMQKTHLQSCTTQNMQKKKELRDGGNK